MKTNNLDQTTLTFRQALRIAHSLSDGLMLNDSPSDRALDLSTDATPLRVEVPKLPQRLNLNPPLINPWRQVKVVRRLDRTEPFDHAAPLSPLRKRDLAIMSRWFDRPDMAEIEREINYQLSLLYPEPPWEEDLDLNFLKDYL